MADKNDEISLSLTANTAGLTKSKAVVSQFADEAVSDFARVDQAAGRTGDALSNKGLSGKLSGLAQSFRLQKGAAQQAGYQIQDFAIQIQGGQSALVAFAQQGSQLAGVLGPGGAVLGAIIAVSTAIGGTLYNSIRKTNDELDKLPTKLEKRLNDIKEQFNQKGVIQADFARVEVGKLNAEYDQIAQSIVENEAKLVALKGSVLIGFDREAKGLGIARDIVKGKEELKDLATLIDKFLQYKNEALLENGKTSEDIELIPKIKPFDLSALENAFKNEQEMMSVHKQNLANIKAGFYDQDVADAIEQNILAQQREAARFDAQIAALGSEHALIEEAETLHQDKLTQINQEYTNKRVALAELEKRAKMTALSSTFNALSSLMNTESSKLFEIGKAAALAGAIVDGFAAVQKTMASVPYPFNIPLAAAQAVASAVQVQNIAKQKIGGGTTANAGSFSGGMPSVNTQGGGGGGRSINASISGLDPSSLFTGSQVRDLFEAINGGLSDGLTINYN